MTAKKDRCHSEAVKKGKTYLFDFVTRDELLRKSHANAFALESISSWAEKNGQETKYIEYSDLGIYGNIARIAKKISTSYGLSREKERDFGLSTLFFILTSVISRIDPFLRLKILRTLKGDSGFNTVILSYPFMIAAFKRSLLKMENIPEITLLELNIESIYAKYNMGNLSKGFIWRHILKILYLVEMDGISQADNVLTVSFSDKRWIQSKFLDKVVRMVPDFEREISFDVENPSNYIYSPELRYLDGNKINIFFVGTSYRLNYESVEHLISISRSLKSIENQLNFVIIGSISKQFSDRSDIPKNMHFTGFIENLKSVSSFADLFYMECRMGTGFESKAYSYANLDRPTIVLGGDPTDFKRFKHSQFVHFSSLHEIEEELALIVNRNSKGESSTIFKITR